ncbi:MAG: ionic transporter y4hA [Phenylobacterium sp.]
MIAFARPLWTWIAPIAGWIALTGGKLGGPYELVLAAALVASVLAAVHHAEVVAHRVGEPYGALVLAVAVTVIEVALIVSIMLSAGGEASGVARDTVFAAVMIILTGLVGLCLLVGAVRHHEQVFGQEGVSAALATLAALAVLTMVLPNFTVSTPGPAYASSQLAFVGAVSLVLYGVFVLIQTVRHRDYFLPKEAAIDASIHAEPPTNAAAWASLGLLVVSLGAVVLLAKGLAPTLETAVRSAGAPQAVVGVVIAALVLAPESLAAVRAARMNRLQTSLNLALGSALASIGLTIPTVAVLSLVMGWPLALGLDGKSTVLLMLTLMVSTLSLGAGRTTVLQGVVHLVIFAVYLFTTVVP